MRHFKVLLVNVFGNDLGLRRVRVQEGDKEAHMHHVEELFVQRLLQNLLQRDSIVDNFTLMLHYQVRHTHSGAKVVSRLRCLCH